MRPYLVGITGGRGSGKRVFAAALAARFGNAPVLHQYQYYRPYENLDNAAREAVNFDHPSACDFGAMTAHLRALRWGNAVEVPVYDLRRRLRTDRTEPVAPAPVIFAEGPLLLHDETLRAQFDLTVYLDAEADIRLIRWLLDAEEKQMALYDRITQYMATIRSMYEKYVAPQKAFASLLVAGDGTDHEAARAVTARIEDALRGR